MVKQDARAVTPRLRFPEFRRAGSWSETKLGGIAESESSSLALNKVALEPQGFPLFGADGLVGRIAFFEQPDGYIGIVKDGSGVGRLTLLPAKSSVLGTLAYVKPALGAPVSLDWLFHCMASLNLKKYVKGSGIPHIYFADYSNEPIGLPARAEQQKIADCLTSLDEVIAAQGRKVDALKAHKRGLMQQLFPREGETRPRLRFPEFRDAPSWDFSLLQELEDRDWIELGRGNVISHDEMRANPGLNPVYSSSVVNQGLMGTYAQHMFDEELISWSIDGGGHFFHRHKHKFSVTNVSGFMRVLSGAIVCRFLAYQLQKLHASHTFDYQQKAHPSVIRALYRVGLPSHGEQQRIADCLSSLDTQITAETHQLAALKTHKQGLMQQLFPAPEVV